MQLTQYTDYSLRVLIYLALKPKRFATITEVSDFYAISRNHLVKVVHNLSIGGFIHTIRGKYGGMTLVKSPEAITIGSVVRATESNFHIAECFNREKNTCVITPACRLREILNEAASGFLALLDRYTLADAITGPGLAAILSQPRPPLPANLQN